MFGFGPKDGYGEVCKAVAGSARSGLFCVSGTGGESCQVGEGVNRSLDPCGVNARRRRHPPKRQVAAQILGDVHFT